MFGILNVSQVFIPISCSILDVHANFLYFRCPYPNVHIHYCISNVRTHYCISNVRTHYCISNVRTHYCISNVRTHYYISDVRTHFCISDVHTNFLYFLYIRCPYTCLVFQMFKFLPWISDVHIIPIPCISDVQIPALYFGCTYPCLLLKIIKSVQRDRHSLFPDWTFYTLHLYIFTFTHI
jgi:hypothetical protein